MTYFSRFCSCLQISPNYESLHLHSCCLVLNKSCCLKNSFASAGQILIRCVP